MRLTVLSQRPPGTDPSWPWAAGLAPGVCVTLRNTPACTSGCCVRTPDCPQPGCPPSASVPVGWPGTGSQLTLGHNPCCPCHLLASQGSSPAVTFSSTAVSPREAAPAAPVPAQVWPLPHPLRVEGPCRAAPRKPWTGVGQDKPSLPCREAQALGPAGEGGRGCRTCKRELAALALPRSFGQSVRSSGSASLPHSSAPALQSFPCTQSSWGK